MSSELKVDLITLGDELLLGIRENGHLHFIGQEFGRHGMFLRRNLTCRDTAEEIRESFLSSWNSADIIITTGGLGPTTDDNTREVIAETLGLELVFDESIKNDIQARFDRLGRQMSDNNLKQCYLPKGAEKLPNPFGTAPGIHLKHDGKQLFMLPGPSSELRPMLESEVIPRLCENGFCNINDSYLQLRTIGVGESHLDEMLSPTFARYPELNVAYCAHNGLVDVRLSSVNQAIGEKQINEIAEECREKLGPDFICYGGCSIAKIIFNHLRADEKTLAVAESCTGGLLSNAFTNIPGASKVFAGGVVCYSNDAKMEMLGVPEEILIQHGAVSAETAVAMATGVAERMSTDYALSITGFAGPSGGTPENPVGTIYIGYSCPCGTWCVRMRYPGERVTVKERAVTRALDVMRRKIRKYKVEDALATMNACG
ncbi:competence/damage-inducible protein A [Rubellicoccus peritrichatus]|uniref:CinA-like protein n=1 Tax=Rubellicoccus peritrichatus TaxID=3080537 RepID=A0AAQ3L8F5_9BACT|nr:competence/damage-inducible protein A [Puniceicoccus sp. CR14]WOO41579.1 competence/damage-inducible protein A [Puniceicoccus sp. CR14]